MQPFIFGHRGCVYEPENTLLSIKKATQLGVDGVEIDVRKCKSKEIIVIHDEKVDRTTNGKGYVKDFELCGEEEENQHIKNGNLMFFYACYITIKTCFK